VESIVLENWSWTSCLEQDAWDAQWLVSTVTCNADSISGMHSTCHLKGLKDEVYARRMAFEVMHEIIESHMPTTAREVLRAEHQAVGTWRPNNVPSQATKKI
jgi:hypothetical protein